MLVAAHRSSVALVAALVLAAPALAGAAAPVAAIAPLGPLECTDGAALATLDGSRSFDPDGEPVALLWDAGAVPLSNAMSSMPTGTFPLGSTLVTLTATDDDGNAGTATREVRVVDTLPPVTAVDLLGQIGENGWYVEPDHAVDVRAVAEDACGGAVATYISVDGGEFVAGDMACLIGDGFHTAEVYSVDAQGNLERRQYRTARLDATAPMVRLLDPHRDQVYVGQGPARANVELTAVGLPAPVVVGGVTLRAEVHDATSGVAKVEFLVDGAVRAERMEAPWAWAWDGSADAGGSHTLTARATDAAGNVAEASQEVFLVPLSAEAVGLLEA